jgi:hypothetical protein
LQFKGLVYIPTYLQKEFIKEQYTLPVQGYQGIEKTRKYIARDYYIQELYIQVEKIVEKYILYNKSKAVQYTLYSLLKLLLVNRIL